MFDSINAFFASLGLAGVSKVFGAAIVFVLCLLAIRVLMRLIETALDKSHHLDKTLRDFIKNAARVVLWIFAAVITAGALGIPMASMVAVISVAGLALSLALQNILANLFSGITLLFTRPFGEGDYIAVGSTSGVVQRIGLFYTVIDTYDKQVLSIPNSTVTGATLTNHSREPLRRVDLDYEASYDAETATVRAAALDAAAAVDKALSEPAPFVGIKEYKDSSICYTVRVWCRAEDYWDVMYGMNEQIRESFKKFGVEMTYNHLNVHMVP